MKRFIGMLCAASSARRLIGALALATATLGLVAVGSAATAGADVAVPGGTASTCTQWSVSGTWTVTQSNVSGTYTFVLSQFGTTVTGNASYGAGGTITGSVIGNQFHVVIDWGGGLMGDYTATVSLGQMTSGYTFDLANAASNATWFATGPGLCVSSTPTSKDQCKDGGWSNYTDGQGNAFKNQGDCVSYVASGGKSDPLSS